VLSLYAETPLPADEWLSGVDLLIVDLHDVGTRVYTYLNHLLLIMRHLDGRCPRLLILDRANPLDGITIEGNRLQPEYFSMVGQLPLPMRHGLTVAEFLLYGRAYHGLNLEIELLKISGWRRSDLFRGPWAPPSPNLPDLGSALLYPGAVMLEGANLSEGRGTTRPFYFCGAPFLDGEELVHEMSYAKFPNSGRFSSPPNSANMLVFTAGACYLGSAGRPNCAVLPCFTNCCAWSGKNTPPISAGTSRPMNLKRTGRPST